MAALQRRKTSSGVMGDVEDDFSLGLKFSNDGKEAIDFAAGEGCWLVRRMRARARRGPRALAISIICCWAMGSWPSFVLGLMFSPRLARAA